MFNHSLYITLLPFEKKLNLSLCMFIHTRNFAVELLLLTTTVHQKLFSICWSLQLTLSYLNVSSTFKNVLVVMPLLYFYMYKVLLQKGLRIIK